ncbi:MAG: hypothetical protein U1E40_15495 [Amaricoccus sp.]
MDPREDVRWKLWAEAFRLWLPVVISLCAISLTVFQAMSTRRHARISVQPRLDWSIDAGLNGEVTYGLVNDGLGPAILKNLDLRLDGTHVGPDGPATCTEIDRRLGRDPGQWRTACFDMEGDFVIRAGDRVVVYSSQRAPGAAGLDHPLGPEEYLRLTASGTYCSFYDECWQLDAK